MNLLGKILAVVVLIAAGLVLTIPSPRYFKSKARVSEAKTNLIALYTAEQTFHKEFHRYSNNFGELGFKPEGRLRYAVGFSPNCSKKETSNTELISDARNTKHIREIQEYFSTLKCVPNFSRNFEAWAVGDIGGDRLDVWKIDDHKNLVHVQDGIPR